MEEPIEKLMIVRCTETDWGYNEGELYWAVTEHNKTFNRVFCKIIDFRKNTFLNCPNKEDMCETFEILAEKEISSSRQCWFTYGYAKKEQPDLWPPTIEKLNHFRP